MGSIPDDSIQLSVTRNKIMTAQYECYQKIMQDPIQQIEGKHDYLIFNYLIYIYIYFLNYPITSLWVP